MRNDESREPPRNASAPECSRPEARTSASIRGVPGTALCFPWPVRSERVTHNADTWQPTTSASRVRRRSMEAGRRSPEQQSVERSSFNPPTRIRFGRDVPFTPLCCPLTSRPGARCAQCACLAIHGERSQGASLKSAGRPSLARAAWSPRSRSSNDHADRATLGRRHRKVASIQKAGVPGTPRNATTHEIPTTTQCRAGARRSGALRTLQAAEAQKAGVPGTLRNTTTHQIPTTTQCRAGARRSTSQAGAEGTVRIRAR